MDNNTLNGFVANKLGKQALKDLENQSKGGQNNAKGNRYEQFFAVYKLAKFYKYTKSDELEISSQEKAFVDDLVILNRSTNTKYSYQLKDSTRVYWNKSKGI